jgi:hypothetical protein
MGRPWALCPLSCIFQILPDSKQGPLSLASAQNLSSSVPKDTLVLQSSRDGILITTHIPKDLTGILGLAMLPSDAFWSFLAQMVPPDYYSRFYWGLMPWISNICV